jgi:hypothetical protein
MSSSLDLESLLNRAIVRRDGHNPNYTVPRTFGVYEIHGRKRGASRRFRFGNHPVRKIELEREFGRVSTLALFESRDDAKSYSDHCN